MTRLTDIHQHLLWGIDDGADSAECMYAMLREAARQGIETIAATCHAQPGIAPFDLGLYRERLQEAQRFCAGENLPVRICSGAEIAWSYQAANALLQGRLPTLGDTDYVLLELWPDISWQSAKDAVLQLMRAGYYPVLAHVERYRCFRWSPRQALRLREETGALFQVNASSLLHPRSLSHAHFVRTLLREYGIDAVATDAHGYPGRPINLRAAHDWLLQKTDRDYAIALTTFSGELT